MLLCRAGEREAGRTSDAIVGWKASEYDAVVKDGELTPTGNAAQSADCLALEFRNNHEMHVTMRPSAVNAVISVKLSGDMAAVSRGNAVREGEAAPEGT